MVQVRWALLAIGAVALAITFVATGDVTARMTAAMGIGSGAIILGFAERIIVRTRTRPETRLAQARQGSLR